MTTAAQAQALLLRDLLGSDGRLFVVSNRGPITFEDDPDGPGGLTAARGSGGLVTALAELGRHAPVTWVAVAITEADAAVAGALRRIGDGQPRASDDRVQALLDETLPDQDL